MQIQIHHISLSKIKKKKVNIKNYLKQEYFTGIVKVMNTIDLNRNLTALKLKSYNTEI